MRLTDEEKKLGIMKLQKNELNKFETILKVLVNREKNKDGQEVKIFEIKGSNGRKYFPESLNVEKTGEKYKGLSKWLKTTGMFLPNEVLDRINYEQYLLNSECSNLENVYNTEIIEEKNIILNENFENKNVLAIMQDFFNPDRTKNLKYILDNLDKIKSLIDTPKENMSENAFIIDVETLQMESNHIRSMRMNKDISDKLDLLAKKYPQYSRSMIINYAIQELVKKYLWYFSNFIKNVIKKLRE